jgi:hypothetical protein
VATRKAWAQSKEKGFPSSPFGALKKKRLKLITYFHGAEGYFTCIFAGPTGANQEREP